jgi:hypothetical protein
MEIEAFFRLHIVYVNVTKVAVFMPGIGLALVVDVSHRPRHDSRIVRTSGFAYPPGRPSAWTGVIRMAYEVIS